MLCVPISAGLILEHGVLFMNILAVDKNGNAVVRGNVFSYDNSGNIINIAPGKVAVLQGLEDYIIVNSDDVLLDCKEGGGAEYKALSRCCKEENKREISVIKNPALSGVFL